MPGFLMDAPKAQLSRYVIVQHNLCIVEGQRHHLKLGAESRNFKKIRKSSTGLRLSYSLLSNTRT
jgi:hypothetical protein